MKNFIDGFINLTRFIIIFVSVSIMLSLTNIEKNNIVPVAMILTWIMSSLDNILLELIKRNKEDGKS